MSNAIDFGYLPRVSSNEVKERVFAAWVKPTALDGTRTIIGAHSDSGGMLIFLSNAFTGLGALHLYSSRYNVQLGWWHTTTTTITNGSWFHVAAYYNHSTTANRPLLWINGIPQAYTERYAPSGTLNSEIGTHLVLGNVKTLTVNYAWKFSGQILDARIYVNRGLSDDEALELFNDGTPSSMVGPKDGMVFQGPVVRTDRLSEFIDIEQTEGTKIFENCYKAAGNVVGTVIPRAAP